MFTNGGMISLSASSQPEGARPVCRARARNLLAGLMHDFITQLIDSFITDWLAGSRPVRGRRLVRRAGARSLVAGGQALAAPRRAARVAQDVGRVGRTVLRV